MDSDIVKRLGEPILNVKAQLEEGTEKLQNDIQSSPLGKFSLLTLILIFQALEITIILSVLSVFKLISYVFLSMLSVLFWLAIVAGVAFTVCIFIIHKSKDTLKASSHVYTLYLVISVCQAILLSYFALMFDTAYLYYECAIILVSLVSLALYSIILKNFSYKAARIIAVVVATLACVAIAIWKMGIFSIILASFAIIVLIYLWLFVSVLEKVKNKAQGGDKIRGAVYGDLLVSRKKVLWMIKSVTFPYYMYRAREERRQETV